MKILLVCGESGTGKTTISQELCNQYPNSFYLIRSYTTRPRRDMYEYDHTFVNKIKMKYIFQKCDVVAHTEINNYCYCATKQQFSENWINVYTIDEKGRQEILEKMKGHDFCTILIKRDNIEDVEQSRLDRDLKIPQDNDVNKIFINNDDINIIVKDIKNYVEGFFNVQNNKNH